MAISHALQLHASGFKVVLDADIKGFFDNLPHQVILQAIRDQVADGKVLDLLERFLRCGVLEDGRLLATTKGTPQGGVISPLLANIVLNRLDWHLDQLGLRFVRYADDFVVLESFYAATHASVHRSLSRGPSSRSRPATETVTPVNLWN